MVVFSKRLLVFPEKVSFKLKDSPIQIIYPFPLRNLKNNVNSPKMITNKNTHQKMCIPQKA